MIKNVQYIKDFIIKVIFSDGYSKTIDFKKMFFSYDFPIWKKYQKVENFKKVKVSKFGFLQWNNDIDIAAEDVRKMKTAKV